MPSENGELDVKLPREYEQIFGRKTEWEYLPVLGDAKVYGKNTIALQAVESCSYGFLKHKEESYMLSCSIIPREAYDSFGIPFWVQSCQAVPPATEPGPDGVRVCEKTLQIEEGKAIDVKIIVDHDMIEAFIDEQIAFTYRIYAKPEFETGILVQDANVEFCNISITGK